MEGISVEQATDMILQYTPVINETEEIELDKTGGRILAQVWWQSLTILLLINLRWMDMRVSGRSCRCITGYSGDTESNGRG